MTIMKNYLRFLFAVLLAASAIGKLADMAGFVQIVASYRLLPLALVPAAAWLLALVELTLAVWLVSAKCIQHAAATLVALHGIYFCWLLIALTRGLSISNCGCFGVYFARPLSAYTLLEDALLLVLAALLWRSARDDSCRTAPSTQSG